MSLSHPSDAAVARVVGRWSRSDMREERPIVQFAASLRGLLTTNPRASVCNAASRIVADGFEALGVECEIVSGGVFMAAELMPHTWVVVDGGDLEVGTDGPLLVDPTVLQFFDGEALVQCNDACPFEGDVAVLTTDDWRWERYYGLRGPSSFDVPNENRDDLRVP